MTQKARPPSPEPAFPALGASPARAAPAFLPHQSAAPDLVAWRARSCRQPDGHLPTGGHAHAEGRQPYVRGRRDSAEPRLGDAGPDELVLPPSLLGGATAKAAVRPSLNWLIQSTLIRYHASMAREWMDDSGRRRAFPWQPRAARPPAFNGLIPAAACPGFDGLASDIDFVAFATSERDRGEHQECPSGDGRSTQLPRAFVRSRRVPDDARRDG